MRKNKGGYNQEKIQRMNRTLILNMLAKEGICSRMHIADLTKLKPATITNIINDFIELRIVKEVGLLTGTKGRRSIGISINNDDFGVLAFRLSRKNYAVGIFNLSGKSVKIEQIEIEQGNTPEKVFAEMVGLGKKMIGELSDRKILAVGMAIPGPYSVKKGRIEIMTGFAGWNEIPIQETLEKTFDAPVFIEQDANTGALAQYWHYDKMPEDELLVYIAAGQGVGAGIVSHGEVMKGTIGTAGEIGHTSINYKGPRCPCGNYGCLELYCSSTAFLKEINETGGCSEKLSLKDAAREIKNGNQSIIDSYLKSCDMLAIGIVNIINSFNPAIIVIGDEMAHIAPDMMLKRVIFDVKERVLPSIFEDTEIRVSIIKNDSMVHGAAIVAIREVFTNPEKYFSPPED